MHRKVEWSDLTHRENSFPTHGMNECIYWSLTDSPHDTVFACCDIQYSSIRLEKLVLNTRRNFELQSSETIIQPARVQASKFIQCVFLERYVPDWSEITLYNQMQNIWGKRMWSVVCESLVRILQASFLMWREKQKPIRADGIYQFVKSLFSKIVLS